MTDMKCPICGKSGIPNYFSQDTVCPCCGSDLSIYRLVDAINDNNMGKKNLSWKRVILTCVAFTLAVFFAVSSILLMSSKNGAVEVASKLNCKVDSLNTEISALRSSLAETSKTTPTAPAGGFTYTVRKGDCLWGISRKLYGNGSLYAKIAAANNLETNECLHIGNKLIIPGIE